MAKTKTVYFCSNCGNESPKWLGKCPNCGEWNTYVEEKVTVKSAKESLLPASSMDNAPVRLSEIKGEKEERILMPSGELNRVLGGGLVPGSIILVGGEPGIGKSTLVLQNMLRIRSRKVLYVSGEESAWKKFLHIFAARLPVLLSLTPSRPLHPKRWSLRPEVWGKCVNVPPLF